MSVSDEFLASLPIGPGVYVMKDAKDRIIYVGKAKSLRSRVRSYFREGGDERISVPFLRGRVASIETILTDNEKEALLLENTLIKKHKPRYNVFLRDDKTYISLRLDVEHQWPRLHRTRRKKPGDKALYFGPYASAGAVREALRFLQRLFPLRVCSDKELERRTRPCILHQIDRCCAPCVGKVDLETYARYVKELLLFLQGQKTDAVMLLESRMQAYSEEMLYEKAALVRDRIQALKKTLEEEKVHSHRRFDRDVVAMARRGGKLVFAVMSYRGGRLENAQSFDLKDVNLEDGAVIGDFVTQYYDGTRKVPLDILFSAATDDADFLTEALSQQRGGPVHLRVPERGEKRRVMDMAMQNAESLLQRSIQGERSVTEMLESLREALNLPAPPRHIECFDISNFQGSFPVGSMVCFKDAEPDKSNYRRFKIRTVEGQNDFAMMKEVLGRRYRRPLKEDETLPSLVIIDGGIGQLNIAVEVFRELDLLGKIPVVGLAKARLKGAGPGSSEPVRTEERLFIPGRKNPVTFLRSDPALHLVERVRDETHRFGVEYHRLLRTKSSLLTGLEEIPNVGPKRRKALLKHFGSLARLKLATESEIASAPGISESLARVVHTFLHPQSEPVHEPGNHQD